MNGNLSSFRDWLTVVRGSSFKSAQHYMRRVRYILNRIEVLDYENLLTFLRDFKAVHSLGHYGQTLAALKVYTQYLKVPELLADFVFPHPPFTPKRFWTREELQRFFDALISLKMKTLFLMGATTGLRKGELLSLHIEDVDFDERIVVPKVHTGNTKHSWVSFYNEECGEILGRYVDSLSPVKKANGKLFPISSRDFKLEWRTAKEKSNIPLKFKDLRDFFAEAMLNLGVQTIYIDAMSGRAPVSVLARHYIDLSPRKLKRIYDQSELKVLS
jgi:integrase